MPLTASLSFSRSSSIHAELRFTYVFYARLHRDDEICIGCLMYGIGMYGQKETDLELGEQWMRVAAELGTTPHFFPYRAPRAAQHLPMQTMHD